MTRRRLKGAMKSFETHINPEKEEQLKWINIETETKVRRMLKLIKSINQGSKDGNSRKKSELIQLTEDFHKQYESLYALYDNLKWVVKRKVDIRDEDNGSSSSSTSSSETEQYYSPQALTRSGGSTPDVQKMRNSRDQKPETSDVEDAVLKDKLTSTSEVKETLTLESLPSFSQVPDAGEVIKDIGIEEGQSKNMTQKLIVEAAWWKDKLNEKEEALLSLTKKHHLYESERLAQIKGLESQVEDLKHELETLSTQRRESKEPTDFKSHEAKEWEEEISKLRAQVQKLKSESRKKENRLSDFRKKYEENELHMASRIEGLMKKASDLQQELDSLSIERAALEDQLCSKTQEADDQRKGLTEELNNLQQKLESLSSQNGYLELELERKSHEVSECNIKINDLEEKVDWHETETTEDKEGLEVQFKDLESEVKSLRSQKNDLEEQMTSVNSELHQSRVEQEELHRNISELHSTLTKREDELSALQKEYEAHRSDTSNQITSFESQISNLQQDLKTLQAEKGQKQLQLESEKQESSQSLTDLEKENIELINKVADQQRTIISLEDVVSELREENKQIQTRLAEFKSSFQAGERKIDEMAEEIRKQFEDNLRILSRRIRVAEQLHVENKEWYRKTRDTYTVENKDLKERVEQYGLGLKNVKELSLTANQMLASLDAVALKFEECTANFMNRISKVSCEMKFAKDWVMRKNKAISHIKDDLDCLLVQLDEKEAEILAYREKVWKSENKAREMEKMVKDKEECMLGLMEEKREAIRQLCVWIDYHRSRSDYYKKTLTDMRCRKPA